MGMCQRDEVVVDFNLNNMPELPEVETVRVQLWNKLKGKVVKNAKIFHPKSVAGEESFAKKLKGRKLEDIGRIGKLLIFKFSNHTDLYMLGHLKMTGQFFVTDKAGKLVGGGGHTLGATTKELPDRHTRVAIFFQDGTTLYFNDMRLFGYLKLADQTGMEAAKSRFGPEPISDNFDHKYFQSGLTKRGSSIKAVLLDQTFVAGLGNIYVDETLFRAKVLPQRLANSLDKKETTQVAKHADAVLKEAILLGGTTFQHFADTDGTKGGFKNKLRVFGRQGQECLRCKAIIVKTRVAGRGTHFCPSCQK